MWPIFAITLIMLLLPISMPCFESNIFFVKIVLKLSYFKKNAKILGAEGSLPDPIANFWLCARVIELL